VTYPSLEHVAMQARIYPARVLNGCKTGLCLFAAGFLGHNDAVHFALAGIQTTCVDLDEVRLRQMARLYPSHWEFVVHDAFDFAYAATCQWDVVSIDPWTSDFHTAAEHVDDFCAIARKAVIVGTGRGAKISPPAGWQLSEFTIRSNHKGGVYWAVLEAA
jgi:hypothetical protein